MANFSYTAVEPSGKKRTGHIEAADEQAAIQLVTSQGRYVLEITESAGHSAKRDSSEMAVEQKKRGRASKSDVALFTRRMADLAGAGLPLDRVLEVLAEQSENQQLSEAAEQSLEDVKTGLPVSEALGKHPKLFPTIYVQSLAAGEASGQFSESAERLADLQENEMLRRSTVISAMIYPTMLMLTAIFVVVFLLTFVVPRMAQVFADMGDALPMPTKILLAMTGFLTGNWLTIIVAIVGIVLGARFWMSTPSGQYARDSFLLRAPIFGTLAQKAVVSRYARVLSTLVHGGVPMLEALRLAGLAAGNAVFKEKSNDVEDDVRDGRGIAEAMRDTGVFPPVLTHMAAIGEETGDLPKMLSRVADSLDFEVDQGLRRATALLEPIIVIAMGAFVAFVVLSVMLPIYGTQDLVK